MSRPMNVTSNHPLFGDTDHIYGYCRCPTPLVNEQITASQQHRYHIVVIQPDDCGSTMENYAMLITYQMSLDQVIDHIRQNNDQILSIERLNHEQ
jgi:hypothetical protein